MQIKLIDNELNSEESIELIKSLILTKINFLNIKILQKFEKNENSDSEKLKIDNLRKDLERLNSLNTKSKFKISSNININEL